MANVTLTAEAHEKILQTIRARADGRECGGCLLGDKQDGTILVDDAGGALRG